MFTNIRVGKEPKQILSMSLSDYKTLKYTTI